MKKMSTAEKIRKHLQDKGLKYTWVCKKVGISNSHFTNIMKGKKNLTIEINDKLNKVLGTDFKL